MGTFFTPYYNSIGIIGVILLLIAYYLLNVNKLSSTSLSYLFLNLFGASGILFSLMFEWNLSAVVIEIAWILISLIGIFRVLRGKNKGSSSAFYKLKKSKKSKKINP